MSELSAKMNDGMLILVGDIDEKIVKTALLTYASGFRTADMTFVRQTVSYQPISGTVMHTAEGSVNSVDMVMSAPMSLTADNYYVAAIASLALRKELANAVSRTGMSLQMRHSCGKEPQERFNLMISLNEASIDGFAPNTAVKNPLLALAAVRSALADPESLNITKEELAAYKALLKKDVAEKKKTPEYWLQRISMRYLDGKDFTTGCDAKIDAVTAEKVKTLLSSLVDGSKVEYIISKK
jgi:predicted Zn-dependent peptidase